MKFAAAALLILTTFAGLGALGVRNMMGAVRIERTCAGMMTAKQRLNSIARREIQLCELALASRPDTKTLKSAEADFQRIQQRYGQLKIENPQAAAIVTIPEIHLREHQTYAWRIYIPPDQPFETSGIRPT